MTGLSVLASIALLAASTAWAKPPGGAPQKVNLKGLVPPSTERQMKKP
jgi:hypothetical protein